MSNKSKTKNFCPFISVSRVFFIASLAKILRISWKYLVSNFRLDIGAISEHSAGQYSSSRPLVREYTVVSSLISGHLISHTRFGADNRLTRGNTNAGMSAGEGMFLHILFSLPLFRPALSLW